MSANVLIDEKNLFKRVAAGDEIAFAQIFFHYVARTQPVLSGMTKSKEATEEIIHDVFVNLWINREKLTAIDDYEAYIFTAVTNRTFTYLKKLGKEKKEREHFRSSEQSNSTEESIYFRESVHLVKQATEQLPSQRKLIFKLSREEGLSHSEISHHLNLSKNTVKNQIVQALKFIKKYLHNTSALIMILLLIINFFSIICLR